MYKLEEKSNNKYVGKMISFDLLQVFKIRYCRSTFYMSTLFNYSTILLQIAKSIC